MRKVVPQATQRKFREEVCSVEQVKNFKDMKDKLMSICKNISNVFDATCQKVQQEVQVQQVASGEEV